VEMPRIYKAVAIRPQPDDEASEVFFFQIIGQLQ